MNTELHQDARFLRVVKMVEEENCFQYYTPMQFKGGRDGAQWWVNKCAEEGYLIEPPKDKSDKPPKDKSDKLETPYCLDVLDENEDVVQDFVLAICGFVFLRSVWDFELDVDESCLGLRS